MDAIELSSVRVELASEAERPLIEGLLQFYIYDFSEMPPADPDDFAFDERGGYASWSFQMADYWRRDGHHPLVIRVAGRVAGFALVNTISHRGGLVERNMGEFFVARLYRRRGVAAEAVRQILALYPGRWEVAVAERNTAAKAFWPRAIAAAGVHDLESMDGDDEHWRGPIWTFGVSPGTREEMVMTGWDGRGLVSTDWLAEHLEDPDLRVFDVTVHLRPSPSGPYQIESGWADYEAAHIPGAAFLDLPGQLSDTASPLPFTMPTVDQLAAALGDAGIGPETRVVAYTTTSPMWATRLWWMLRSGGFGNAAVLDGGIAKWRAQGRPVEAGERRYAPTRLALTPRPGAWADKQAVLAAIGDGGVCTINALSPSAHSGESPLNYGRKGHIAGSRNVPYATLLNDDGTWRHDEDLRAQFEQVGALERPRAICYCGGGISATMAALALTRLGHTDVAVYDGSLSEWSRDPAAPMETGT